MPAGSNNAALAAKVETNMKTLQTNLQQDVLAELQWEPSLDSSRIGVAVDSGVVVLTGTVTSLVERQAAERAVKRVKGVTAVANELQVRLGSGLVRDDVHIAKAAQEALRWNVQVPDENIKVTVSKGYVTLDGAVQSAFQRRAAEHAVENLIGVVSVTNRITIAPQPSTMDVRRQLNAALHRHACVEASNIETELIDGRLTLSGTVGSWAERTAVEDAAWSVPGITTVDDRIEVRP